MAGEVKQVVSNPTASGTALNPAVIIQIPNLLRQMINAIVHVAEKEILWVGIAEKVARNVVTLREIFVPKEQRMLEAHVDANAALTEYSAWLKSEGREADIAKINYFGHSHAAMSVFFSGSDIDTMNIFVEPRVEGIDVLRTLVSTVHNKANEVKAQVTAYVPSIGIVHAPAEVRTCFDADVLAWARKEVADVKPPTFRGEVSQVYDTTRRAEVAFIVGDRKFYHVFAAGLVWDNHFKAWTEAQVTGEAGRTVSPVAVTARTEWQGDGSTDPWRIIDGITVYRYERPAHVAADKPYYPIRLYSSQLGGWISASITYGARDDFYVMRGGRPVFDKCGPNRRYVRKYSGYMRAEDAAVVEADEAKNAANNDKADGTGAYFGPNPIDYYGGLGDA